MLPKGPTIQPRPQAIIRHKYKKNDPIAGKKPQQVNLCAFEDGHTGRNNSINGTNASSAPTNRSASKFRESWTQALALQHHIPHSTQLETSMVQLEANEVYSPYSYANIKERLIAGQ